MSTHTSAAEAITTSAQPRQNGHVLERRHANGVSMDPSTSTGQQPSLPLDTSTPRSSSKSPPSSRYKHTFAVHSESRPSCLGRDSPSTPSFMGFRNLMFLVLLFSNLRLMIENFRKYGILVTIWGGRVSPRDWQWAAVMYVLTPCFLFLAYAIEALAAAAAKEVVARKERERQNGTTGIGGTESNGSKETERKKKSLFSTWRVIALLHGFNATFMLALATYVVYFQIHNPGLGTFTELHAVIVWLKVCSYAFTNRDLRHAMVNAGRNPHPTSSASAAISPLPALYASCPYPANITLKNLGHFWWVPSLVYQPVYPMTDRIRWSFVGKRLAEFVGLCLIIWVTVAQYAVPLLDNSLGDISALRFSNIAERLLKLSTISLVCWLCGFLALFQCFLNALAEVTYFADREFYTDWWNTPDIRTYWTSWNKPVTHFMKRHIYTPMAGRGVPPTLAQILTFLFSGFLHELLIGVPTHNILWFAFLGMVVQLPLIFFTDVLVGKNAGYGRRVAGNCFFWCTFCILGQPAAAMGYYFAWQAKYGERALKWPGAFKR